MYLCECLRVNVLPSAVFSITFLWALETPLTRILSPTYRTRTRAHRSHCLSILRSLFPDCIGGIYKEMTVSNLHPHGGEATLTLLSRDEPFDREL